VTEPVVIKGNPTDEEVAAVVAALTALAGAPRAEPEAGDTRRRPDGWNAYWRAVRAPLRPAPGAWRAAARGF
jgi:hypothetical protein